MESGISPPMRQTIADAVKDNLNDTTLGANLHLFVNDFTPSPLAVVGDFVEADFAGYVAKTALTAFARRHDGSTGDYKVYLPTRQIFTATTLTAALTVIGAYITNSTDATLKAWQRFPDPIQVAANGDTVAVDVELGVPLSTMQET